MNHGWPTFVEGLLGGVLALVGVVAPVARWAWKRFMLAVIAELRALHLVTEQVRQQVTSNGGHSNDMATRVARTENQVARIEAALDLLSRRLPPPR